MGLESTVKRHKLLTAYLAFGAVYAYMQAKQATAVWTGTSTTEVWGGFGTQNSRMNSIIQTVIFWPYALAVGNAAVNAQEANDQGNDVSTMLGAGQTWTSGS